jgi:hypothetical protein
MEVIWLVVRHLAALTVGVKEAGEERVMDAQAEEEVVLATMAEEVVVLLMLL